MALYDPINHVRICQRTISRQSNEMLGTIWFGGLDETIQNVMQ